MLRTSTGKGTQHRAGRARHCWQQWHHVCHCLLLQCMHISKVVFLLTSRAPLIHSSTSLSVHHSQEGDAAGSKASDAWAMHASANLWYLCGTPSWQTEATATLLAATASNSKLERACDKYLAYLAQKHKLAGWNNLLLCLVPPHQPALSYMRCKYPSGDACCKTHHCSSY